MSRAFVKENDLEHAGIDIPERPISPEKNYVTPNGLKELKENILLLEQQKNELMQSNDYSNKQTIGRIHLLNDKDTVIESYYSLELPDKNNKKRISCIPEGSYMAHKHTSPKFGKCLWIKDIPNRSEVLIHRGNYYTDILGCILIGSDLKDINKDGVLDLVNSSNSVKSLLKMINQDIIEIEIVKL